MVSASLMLNQSRSKMVVTYIPDEVKQKMSAMPSDSIITQTAVPEKSSTGVAG